MGHRLQAYFTERLLPDAVFQITPGGLSGIRVSRSDRSIKGGFVQPFRERPVVPSFDRPNVADPAALEEAIDQGKKNLRLSSGRAGLLIPEASVRVFVLGVDAFPASGKERDTFLRWRIARQMPLIPEDARIDYAVTPGRGARKVLVVMARQMVVWEYEALFEKAGLKPVLVSVPSLALVNLARREAGANVLLLNLEAEALTLLALTGQGWSLYRLKDIGPPGVAAAEERTDNIVREAENTIRFLEDKEKARTDRLYLRSSDEAEVPEVARRLQERTGLPVETVNYEAPRVWSEAHKALLAPLIGQVQ
jgi:Tfp pilus assembly PilM family ATPase